jgi:outer membrane protein assembly factor BamB
MAFPGSRKCFILAIATLFAGSCVSTIEPPRPAPGTRVDMLTYHFDRQRSGWNPHESILTPAKVATYGLELVWQSPQLDAHEGEAPVLFASPLYVDNVRLENGPYFGLSTSIVIAATSTGYVYAINAGSSSDIAPGEILWSQRLSTDPCRDGRMSILSTPVIDIEKGLVYVSSCDSTLLYRVFAFALGSGKLSAGWPVVMNPETVNVPGLNRNGANDFPAQALMYQRGALNLSNDRSRLFVPFGKDHVSGWLISINTRTASIDSAFSTTAVTAEHQGGMWAASGTSIDAEGRVHIATGASIVFTSRKAGIAGVFPDSNHNWGQSIIQLQDSNGLQLSGTYTPFDYCRAQAADIDLGSSGTVVIDIDASKTSTPKLVALVGGKQGNAYLLDRDNMPGSLVRRQGCSDDPASDKSLLSPEVQPHFGTRGPLSVFGPYSADLGFYDYAKSRTTAAQFRDASGNHFLFATGSTKVDANSTETIAPTIVRLVVVTEPDKPAYLAIDRRNMADVLLNPGSPFVSSNNSQDAIVWVLDMNAMKSISVWDKESPPQPVLYAFDAESLAVLWKGEAGDLPTSGKYNEPAVVNGQVIVGTDRIMSFGLKSGRE